MGRELMAVILKLFNMKPKLRFKMARLKFQHFHYTTDITENHWSNTKIPEIPENTSDFLGMYRFH